MPEEISKKAEDHQSSGKKKDSTMEFVKTILTPGHLLGKVTIQLLDAIGLKKPLENLLYQVEDPLLHMWFSKSYDLKIFNEELIPPTGPVVFACNHQSILDPLISGLSIFHKSRRMAFQLTKMELGDDPMLGNYVTMNHVVFIRRGENDEEAIKQCVRILTEDQGAILVYPEGTWGPGHGEFLPFKSGVVRIAMLGNATIVPMASYGVDEIMGAEASRKFKLKTKGVLRVKFGKPIPVKELVSTNDSNDKEALRKAAAKLQTIVHSLWEELAKNESNPS